MSTTAIDNTEIKYDRITKDFAILVDGVAVAYGRNYSDAEAKRTAYLADRDGDGDDAPDLIAEAAILRNTVEEMRFDLEADYQAEGCLPLAMMQYHTRLGRIIAKAGRRLQRREFAELGGVDFTPPDVEFVPVGWAA